MRLRLLLLILGLIVAAPVRAETEISAPLGNAILHLPLPAAYCSIDITRPVEAKLFELQDKVLQPQNRLLGFAMMCDELAAYRAENRQFEHYLIFMALLESGAPAQIPDSQRATFLAELATQLPQLDVDTLAGQIGDKLESVGVSAKIRRFGRVGQDEAAVYIGTVATVEARPLAGVGASTVAGGFAATASFYQPYADESSVTVLLDMARREAQAMIAANAPGAPSPAEPAPQVPDLSGMVATGGTDGGAADFFGPISARFDRATATLGLPGIAAILAGIGALILMLVLLVNRLSR
jgi:hypothetical protein